MKSCKDDGTLFVVRHSEPVNRPAAGRETGKEKETCKNCQGFRFPNTGDLCHVQSMLIG